MRKRQPKAEVLNSNICDEAFALKNGQQMFKVRQEIIAFEGWPARDVDPFPLDALCVCDIKIACQAKLLSSRGTGKQQVEMSNNLVLAKHPNEGVPEQQHRRTSGTVLGQGHV